ncbi:hypothetical protein RND81_11G115000 [Saponaria officinalis]|uniref:Uncharacterized protein n=1 Tax=Saponaria officinalis TaxID=3572 RepID=A0AAW1HJU0_SAPOF
MHVLIITGFVLGGTDLGIYNRPSVFKRLSKEPSVGQKLEASPHSHEMGAVLKRLGTPTKSALACLGVIRNEEHPLTMANQIEEEEVRDDDNLRSSVPSCMKRLQVVDIVKGNPLRVKKRARVLTKQPISYVLEDNIKEKEDFSSTHSPAKSINSGTSST